MVCEKQQMQNPFEEHQKAYREARQFAQMMPETELDADWIRNKRSNGGSRSPSEPVTYVLPGSADLIRI